MPNEWTSVKILKNLAEEIEDVLPETSLSSVARYVDYAIRQQIIEDKMRRQR